MRSLELNQSFISPSQTEKQAYEDFLTERCYLKKKARFRMLILDHEWRELKLALT
jgi:hypothetical protein